MAVEEYVNKLGQKRYQPLLEDGDRLWVTASGLKKWQGTPLSFYEPVLYPKFWAEFIAQLQQRRENRNDWKAQRDAWEKNE